MILQPRAIIVREGDTLELYSAIIAFLEANQIPRQAVANIKWQFASRNVRSTDGIIKKVNEMLRPWRLAFHATRGMNTPGILVYDFVRV